MPWPTLASTTDLANYTGQTVDPVIGGQALGQATAEIQGYTKQNLFQVTNDTITLDPQPGFGCFLPELPVTAVSSFSWLDDVNGTGWNLIPASQYRWNARGELYLIPNAGFDLDNWPTDKDTLQAVCTHGYAAGSIPYPLQAVCLAVASRLMVNPYAAAQTQTGGVRVAYSGVGCLLESEKDALSGYMLPAFA